MRIRTINIYEDHHIKREIVVGLFKNKLFSIDTTYKKDYGRNKLIPRHKTYTITNDNIPMGDDKSVVYKYKEYDVNGKRLDIEV